MSFEEKAQADRDVRALYLKNTQRLDETIKPLRTAMYEVDYAWGYIGRALEGLGEDYGGIELNPDFQRGHVWTPDQQRHYIENVLRGVVSTSGLMIQLNCPNWGGKDYDGDLPHGVQCIDGLQRITAVQKFMAGEVQPFGLCVRELEMSAYSAKGATYRFRVAIHNFTNRADLLQHYLDLNRGGTPHSDQEIERVQALRDLLVAVPPTFRL